MFQLRQLRHVLLHPIFACTRLFDFPLELGPTFEHTSLHTRYFCLHRTYFSFIWTKFEPMAAANPPQPVPQLGPQPNFANLGNEFQNITNGLQGVSTELGNFANLPVFVQGVAIMNTLQQIQGDIQRIRRNQQLNQNRTNRDLATIRNDVQQIRTDLQTFRSEVQRTNRAS